MNITVVGTGYVGLVTGTCFANAGNRVTCLDIDAKKVETLVRGESPFFEPRLSELMTRSIQANRLTFTHDIETAYSDADVIFVCVGTPTGEDGRCDLANVFQVADDISTTRLGSATLPLVIIKSTVPVGTTNRIAEKLNEFVVANNPEFLREGNAIDDFKRPDRIICGVEDPDAIETLTKLYAPFVGQGRPLLFFDIRSSEMVKYAKSVSSTKLLHSVRKMGQTLTMSVLECVQITELELNFLDRVLGTADPVFQRTPLRLWRWEKKVEPPVL